MNTAFDIQFESWPPATAPVRHGIPSPIGSIRVAWSGKSQHREIKVRMDRRPQDRWMNLARFWWLRHKGAIPDGMRVCHVDGDTLNDDPRNYALGSAGDVLTCYHIDHPAWSKRQHRRKGRGAARFNRDRSLATRARRWLPSQWYAVDLERQIIHNDPKRERWQVYAAHVTDLQCSRNGRGFEGAVLGCAGNPRRPQRPLLAWRISR